MLSRTSIVSVLLAGVMVMTGCAVTGVDTAGKGTIPFFVEIESSDAGARVEANGENVGKTPMTLKIYGDKDGTFHNFGSQSYVIEVFPVRTNQFVQSKVFRTGGMFSEEDKIPKRLYFDLNRKPEGFSLDRPRN